MGLIRFFLALIVAADHFTVINLMRLRLTTDGVQQWIFMNAGYSVMFFYVVSGFLISYVLEHKYECNIKGTFSFYKSRFVRIFSLYWPLLLISFLFYGAYNVSSSVKSIMVNVFIFGGDWIRAFANYPAEADPFHPLLGQVWSISAELTFYLLAPIVFRSLRASILLVVFSLVTRISLENIFNFHQAWDYHFFPAVFWFFLLGHLARELHSTGWTKSRWIIFMLIGASCVAMIKTTAEGFVSPWFYASVVSFALALPGIFKLTKDVKWVNFFGNLSYPIYMVHIWVVWQFSPVGHIDIIKLEQGGVPLPAIIVMYLIYTIAIAVAVHYLIEKPCVKVFNRLLAILKTNLDFSIVFKRSNSHA